MDATPTRDSDSHSHNCLLLKLVVVEPKLTHGGVLEERLVFKRFHADRESVESGEWSTSMIKRLIRYSFPSLFPDTPELLQVAESIWNQIGSISIEEENLVNVYFWKMQIRENPTDEDKDSWFIRVVARVVHCGFHEREYVRDATEANDAEAERIRSLKRVGLEVKEKEDSEEELRCSICFESLVDGSEVNRMACGSHVFHRRCIAVWLQKSDSCPLCRSQVPTY